MGEFCPQQIPATSKAGTMEADRKETVSIDAKPRCRTLQTTSAFVGAQRDLPRGDTIASLPQSDRPQMRCRSPGNVAKPVDVSNLEK